MPLDPHTDLFFKMPKLGLPTSLTSYLLYNVSVDDGTGDISSGFDYTEKHLLLWSHATRLRNLSRAMARTRSRNSEHAGGRGDLSRAIGRARISSTNTPGLRSVQK